MKMSDPEPYEVSLVLNNLYDLKGQLLETSVGQETVIGDLGLTALLGLADLIVRLENLEVLPVKEGKNNE